MLDGYKRSDSPIRYRLINSWIKMALSTVVLVALIGFVTACVSLPQVQYVNNRPYHLMQYTECKGGKIFEINNIRDIDECKAACVQRDCQAVNLYQLGEFDFKCEILAYVRSYNPVQGAACYVAYPSYY
ncbi:hypothetical protein M3Y94_00239300 [Aphelenchoides besseyi]|nr:hypothetical protein M3Y94_00239300 [Aphelenchoides besseyi]KAI6236366.1 hypothetical protein M3Y95_00149800 [Aphelenchoides besseyi]